jgi:ABC-type bacteriocin/lantibiotic exporter with double-glycine peptidase domain
MSTKLPLPTDALLSLSQLVNEGQPTGLIANTGLPLLTAARYVAEATGIAVSVSLASNASLQDIASGFDCRMRQVHLNGRWWLNDNGPLLAFDQAGMPFALLPNGAGSYVVKAGEDSKTFALTPAFAKNLQPLAVMFYRSLGSGEVSFQTFRDLALFLGGASILKLFMTQAFMGLVSLLIPIAMGRLFGDVIPNAEYYLLSQWTWLLIVGVVLTGFLSYHQALLFIRLRFRLNIAFQSSLWDRLLRLPLTFLHRYAIGDLTLRSLAFDQCQQALSAAVVQGALSLVFAVFPLILMFYYVWSLALIALASMLLTFLFYCVVFIAFVNYERRLLEQRSRLTSWIVQLIENVSRIRSNGAEERMYHVWVRQFMASVATFFNLNRWSVWLSVWNAGVSIAVTMLLFAFAATRDPVIDFGHFIGFITAFGLFSSSIYSLNQLLLSLAPIMPWLERVKPLLLATPENSEVGSTVPLQGRIAFEAVSFGYESQSLILDQVSFEVEPGECIGIIGASGAGKSTLIRLLLGFLTPNHGEILIDQHSLSHLNLSAYRRQLGVVLQQDALISGTILDNLTDGLFVDEANIHAALARVSLTDMIASLPMGLQTMLTDNGLSLSAGERQRLLIARALIHQPKILLLDEASSALDNVTQASIHQALLETKQTTILIAQRLSTLKHANRIYQLQTGKLLPA